MGKIILTCKRGKHKIWGKDFRGKNIKDIINWKDKYDSGDKVYEVCPYCEKEEAEHE